MERVKYPRTPHLPYSQSKTDDDKTLQDDSQFEGMEVVVTIKMDGENLILFKTQKDAQQAIKILGEETVKLALEPLGI